MTRRVPPLGVFTIACAGSVLLGRLIEIDIGIWSVPAIWPLGGVLLGGLLLSERRRWPVLVGTACSVLVLADVLSGRPLLHSLILAFVSSVESVGAAWMLRRAHGQFSLTHTTHVGMLIGVAALTPMLGGMVATALLGVPPDAWFVTWRTWWLMSALGMLLTTPLVVAAAAEWPAALRSPAPRMLELTVLLGLGGATSTMVFGTMLNPLVQVPAYTLPFMLWAAFRFGVAGTATTLVLILSVGMWHTAQGHGPFALPGANVADWVLRSQGAAGMAAISFLLMSAVVAERKRIAHENERLVADLQKALADIKTLEGLIPICAWCHKVRDDAGFWQQIESYVGARTDATFSHSICPTCADRAELETVEPRH